MKSLFKILIKYPLEFLFFIIFFTVFKILPLSISRTLGILITTSVGPFLPIHKLLIRNLSIFMIQKFLLRKKFFIFLKLFTMFFKSDGFEKDYIKIKYKK